MTVAPEARPHPRHAGFDADEAQDLVQETYVKALRYSSHFTWGTGLKAWLLTILRHTAANRRRDRRRSRVDVDRERVERAEVTVAAPGETPEEALLRTTLDPQLQGALETLPTALREAAWLRDVEEMTYKEMATRLDIPIGTVMSRISRGRHTLYEALADRLGRTSGGAS